MNKITSGFGAWISKSMEFDSQTLNRPINTIVS